MIARIIRASADNPVVVVLVFAALTALGALAMTRAPLDAVPDVSDPQVVVVTEWEGRSADLVEDQITYPLTTALSSQPGVRVVRAQSTFGVSFVTVIFHDGEDPLAGRARVLEAISGRVRLPADARPLLGPDASGVGWVLEYALTSRTQDLGALRTLQDFTLKPALQAVDGVAEVASLGGFSEELVVHVDPVKLRALELSFPDVVSAVRGALSDVGGHVVEMGGHELMVRARASNATPDDLALAPLPFSGGVAVHVGDVADVAWGPGPRRGVADLDGKGEVVGGIVVVRRGENALRVIDAVKDRLAELERALPPETSVVLTYDRSDLIERALATLKRALLEELLVTALVVLLFLWNARSAIVPMITLPVAVLLSFLPVWSQGLTVNLMSLGGIAVAIGAMVDASIVVVENVHRKRAHVPAAATPAERARATVDAMVEVGPSIFFSLLVMTVAFVPVFTLPGVEGRLFSPLAFTKTYAMAAAALVAVTLTPALVMLVRSRSSAPVHDRQRVLAAMERTYEGVVRKIVRRPSVVITLALVLMGITVPALLTREHELMPALDEGSLLYMPTSPPGMSIAEARDAVQALDARLAQFPEVSRVFGKLGRAETATDPAPIGMAEIVVTLKPTREWRPGLTRAALVADMDRALQVPGMPNIWWMPIQTRTEMLATGVRSPLAIQVKGDATTSARALEDAAVAVEAIARGVPGVRSAVAERLFGALSIDVDVRREAAARAGLSVRDVHDVVEIAVGGARVSEVLDGRAKKPVRVRAARELREDPAAIADLVVRPMGDNARARGSVRIGDVADVTVRASPDMVKSEDGELLATVFIDVNEGVDAAALAAELRARTGSVALPSGVHLAFTGQIEHLELAKSRLVVVVPIVLLLIALLLYASTRSAAETAIVLCAVPFSLVGAVWLLVLLGQKLSLAVWIGVIALLGLDAETGVVMLLYLTLAHQAAHDAGKMQTRAQLEDAIVEGAAKRLRPKLMTVLCAMIGLVPLLWATGTGADVMKPVAIPMVGGLLTSFLLELLVYPALFALWKRRALPRQQTSAAAAPVGGVE